MSTYWYYECLSHDPPLRSEFEVTQHTDHYLQTAIDFATAGIAPWRIGEWFWNQTQARAQDWLKDHASCAIDMVSEYGDHMSIPGREARGLEVVLSPHHWQDVGGMDTWLAPAVGRFRQQYPEIELRVQCRVAPDSEKSREASPQKED